MILFISREINMPHGKRTSSNLIQVSGHKHVRLGIASETDESASANTSLQSQLTNA